MTSAGRAARIVIIGGGVTALAAAHRLRELDPAADLLMLEAGPRLGGVLQTVEQDGFLIEQGADNFITNVPWGLDLCRRLGIESDLIPTQPSGRRVQVVFRGRLHDVPDGFMLMTPTRLGPMLRSPLLSPLGKLRLLAEPLIPRAPQRPDESLASFARRRLGREVFQRLVQPLIGGIYTADPERLSLAATLPRFLHMERQYGSLIRAGRRSRDSSASLGDGERASGARYGLFVTPRGGMQGLIAALASRISADNIRLHAAADRLTPLTGGGWQISLAGNNETLQADGVIVAIPAYRAAALLGEADAELAELLDRIPYASSAVVCTAYRIEDIGRPIESFGFVVPACERRRILAGSFSSVKFAGRAGRQPADASLRGRGLSG